jgi:hypothetical protein
MLTSRRTAVVAVGLLLGGCGLLNALDKIKGFTFTLPRQTYTVSTSNPNWRSPPAGGLPAFPCGSGQLIADCCAPPVDCTRSPLVCEAERCALKFTYEQVQAVNLARDVPELGQYNGMIFTQVLLKQLELEVNNQLNITTPPVQLFVAPANVTSPSAAGAHKLATIPMQAPRSQGKVIVPLDAAAQQVFSNFARDFQTPFNIILTTTILVKSGDPVPSGQVDFAVSGQVEAKL